jgi:hypothetical protein
LIGPVCWATDVVTKADATNAAPAAQMRFRREVIILVNPPYGQFVIQLDARVAMTRRGIAEC